MMNGNSRYPETAPMTLLASADLICLSHLRWNFVFQRPEHLMSPYAKPRRVYFVEEPIFREHLSAATVTMERHGQVRRRRDLRTVPSAACAATSCGPEIRRWPPLSNTRSGVAA